MRRVFGGFLEMMRSYEPSTFAGTGLILVYRITDLDTSIVLDTTVEPKPGAMFDAFVGVPEPPKPTCVFEMSSDSLDRLFLGTLTPTVALATGRVKARGDYLIAMRMIPALERAIPFYRKWRETEKIESSTLFPNLGEFKRLFGGFAGELCKNERVVGTLAGSGIVAELRLTDIEATVVIDASTPPRDGAFCDIAIAEARAVKPACRFELTGDAFDRLLLGQLRPMRGVMAGEIRARGNYLKALKLLPFLKRVVPVYRAYQSTLSGSNS